MLKSLTVNAARFFMADNRQRCTKINYLFRYIGSRSRLGDIFKIVSKTNTNIMYHFQYFSISKILSERGHFVQTVPSNIQCSGNGRQLDIIRQSHRIYTGTMVSFTVKYMTVLTVSYEFHPPVEMLLSHHRQQSETQIAHLPSIATNIQIENFCKITYHFIRLF
jgi:hypothetical protein